MHMRTSSTWMGIFLLNCNPVGDPDTFLFSERQSDGSILNAPVGVGLCSSPLLSQNWGFIPVIILSVDLEVIFVFCVCVLLRPMGPAIMNLEPPPHSMQTLSRLGHGRGQLGLTVHISR